MTDRISPERRSENMRRICSKDTNPEIELRAIVHSLGYRFRLHRDNLPGKPDLVFPSRRKVIFVHGCFWHQHSRCKEGRIPASRRDYWLPKLTKNRERDSAVRHALRNKGWKILTVWECQLKSKQAISKSVTRFLSVSASLPPRSTRQRNRTAKET